jgi:hypothetical protein
VPSSCWAVTLVSRLASGCVPIDIQLFLSVQRLFLRFPSSTGNLAITNNSACSLSQQANALSSYFFQLLISLPWKEPVRFDVTPPGCHNGQRLLQTPPSLPYNDCLNYYLTSFSLSLVPKATTATFYLITILYNSTVCRLSRSTNKTNLCNNSNRFVAKS